MKLKFPPNYYKWQPELAVSVIYWSWTWGIFFLSVITALENNGINLLAVVIMVFFLLFFNWGRQRYFLIENQQLVAHALLSSNSFKIPLASIQSLALGSHGLVISYQHDNVVTTDTTIMVMMSKKELGRFITALKKQPDFTGKIENAC